MDNKGDMRKSSIELLRIICMLMIILHHASVHGGSLYIAEGFNKDISIFIYPGGKLAFDCFIVISTWFICEKAFKTERFLKVWLETLFYSVVFTLVAVALDYSILNYQWLGVKFVIFGDSHLFAASYLLFYLLTPFLSLIIKRITKNQLKVLIILLFMIEVFAPILWKIISHSQPFSSELTLFILLYFTSFYLKKYPLKITEKKIVLSIIFMAIWVMNFFLWKEYLTNNNRIINFLVSITENEASITNIIGGYCLFFIFKNINIKDNKIINLFAQSTLAVLLVHDHNYFKKPFWNKIINYQSLFETEPLVFILMLLLIAFGTYFVITIIDIIRKYWLEKVIFKNKSIQKICCYFDELLNEEKEQNESQ